MLYEKHLFYICEGKRDDKFFTNDKPCEAILIGPIPNNKTLNSHYKHQGSREQKYSIFIIDNKLYKSRMFLYNEHNKPLPKETIERVFDMLRVNLKDYIINGELDLKKSTQYIRNFAHAHEIKNGIYGLFGQKYWFLYKVQPMLKEDILTAIDHNEFSIDNLSLLKIDVALEPFKKDILNFVLKNKN